MANGKKTYEIVINGIQQSVDAVESLNKQLDALEKRIDALAKKNVNVSASGGGSNKSALDEEAKILQKIDELHQKVAASEKQEYQELLHAKEELKEYQTIAKAIAAQSNIDQGINNTNTMAGMKAQLHDIKAAMQTVDINSDQFKKLTADANELNQKLKEIEQSYGVFSRSVGNYVNGVADGISKYKVQIGDTVREFDSAKQAAKELSNELLNLPKGAEGAQELRKAIQSIKSDIKDLAASSNVMDNLLDTMQSFTAIGSVAEGFSALFGFDNDAIEQSIQKLVALQNVMQGLEQLNQQMNTGEGIMGWIGKGNDMIDSFVEKLTGAAKAQKTLNTETTAGATASKTLATAEKAQAAATGAATVATKALSLALKTIGIGLVISAVATLITYWKDIYNWFTDTIPALKNLSTWFDKVRAAAVGVGTAIVNFLIQPQATLAKTIAALIKGNFSEIPKIIGDGLNKTFNVVKNFQKGYHKETERQQEKHNKKMREQQRKANEEQLKDEEAKYGTSHRRTQEYYRKQMELTKQGSEEYKEYQRRLWEDERREREENERKRLKGAKDAAKNNSEILKAEKETQEKITSLRIEIMKEGLAKELAQLKEDNRKKIAEIKENGKDVENLLELQAQNFEESKKRIFESYWDETYKIVSENVIKDFENNVDYIENRLKELSKARIPLNKAATWDERNEVIRKSGILNMGQRKMLKEVWGNSGDLESSFQERLKRIEAYYTEVITDTNDLIREAGIERKKILDKQFQDESDAINKEIRKINIDAQQIGIDFDANNGYRKYLEKIRDENRDTYTDMEKQGISYINRMDALYNELERLNKKYENDRLSLAVEIDEKLFNSYESLYNRELETLNEYFDAAQKLAEKQPVYNADGFIAISQSKRNYDESLRTIDAILEKIRNAENELYEKKELGLISPETYTKTVERLYSLEEAAKQAKERVQKNIKQLLPSLLRQIEDVFQILGQAATQVIQSIGEINQAAFEEQMERLDDETDALQKQLDKQKELTQQYADDVNSIEDELANSRGDRRQHLIDQLNAQMAAQRESLAEQKRIEKEQEKLDKKKKQLDYENEMRKWNQSKMTAAINAALAISNAAVNTWPIPAIPMIAAATAIGAAQIAAVLAQKPKKYADGGVLQGKSHRQGGIKTFVGGKPIELEGNEYVIRKATTTKNIDLLDYINKSEKKLSLSDFIDFYSSKGVRNNITKVDSKIKYADGGVLPTLRNDININDRVLSALEAYNERNVVVQVVDVINKADDLKRVQVLAGLNPTTL